jgi:hypothetical protein
MATDHPNGNDGVPGGGNGSIHLILQGKGGLGRV